MRVWSIVLLNFILNQGSHYFEIRGKSDFSNLKRVIYFFNTNKQKTNTSTYNVCKSDTKSERCYANKNKELNNYWIYLNEGFRAPTTLKSEGEVTSLSGADKREVKDNREKWWEYREKSKYQKTNTRTYNVCKSDTKSERWYANKNKELNNYWIYLNA
jgi:hypothetical protein